MKHLKYALRKNPKFKHFHKKKVQDNDTIEIKGGGIFSKNSNIWNIQKDYGSTMGNNIIIPPNDKSGSTLATNGGGINLHGIDRKLMDLNFGKKQKKIKF